MKRLFLRILLLIGISFLLFIAYFAYLIIDATSVSDGIPIQHYQNQKTALLVIDIQEGITGDFAVDQTYVDQAPEFIKTVNELISIADSLKIPVIYIQQQTENWLLNWADGYVLAKGVPGVALDSRLTIISANHFTNLYQIRLAILNWTVSCVPIISINLSLPALTSLIAHTKHHLLRKIEAMRLL